ncbi:MAG TPA: ATP-binding protein [Polyangia bacterium]|jgi:PAS domain S-box|nr:ATP-binding protein [Polyangia bacterium]
MRHHARFLAALWTGCLAASLVWNLHEQREKSIEIAHISAQVTFDNDVLYRRWAAQQGGVYVPVSEHTPPNPYLNVPNRDVTTTSGLPLTLLNPAYMARQVNQLAQQGRGSRAHLTSLKPLRPENAPDAFETAALKSFEEGVKEVSAFEGKERQDLRLMRPLLVEKPCLKCHAQQGYKEGDIRGGISVSVPMEPILAIERPQVARTSIGHGLVWLLGLAGLTLWGRGLEKQISARERAEQAARHHAAELEAAFAAMTHGIMVYDAAGSMVRANAAARALYDIDPIGVDIETLAKHLSSRRLDGRPILREEMPTSRALKGEQVLSERFVLTRSDGQEMVVSFSSAPLQLGGQAIGAVTVCTDITDLIRTQEALREADRRKDEFLGVLSHELRNPLAPIRNSLFILDRAPPGGDQARRAQAVIDRQVGYLTRLVDDLLDVTRIARDKIQLQRESLDLTNLVRRTIEDYRSLFEKSEVHIETALPAQRIAVNADRTRLAQIVGNLLQNAAKFTDRGGRTQVSVAVDEVAGRAIIRIANTGAGIPPKLLPHLFQPFTQADETMDRSKGGLGLGLALVKGLVDLHGGDISAHSEGIGKGAEFIVRLPLDGETVTHTPTPVDLSHRNRRVLIIEDQADGAQSLREALELCGHQVEVADNGPAGLTRARAFRPEVVLCDIGLPGMDGYAVARAFRADEALKDVFLVALSGYARPDDLLRSAEAGFDQHLAKPPRLDKLEELLSSLRKKSSNVGPTS